MISTATYSNFFNYCKENRLAGGFYFFIEIIDDNANTYQFSDYHTELSDYIPANIEVRPVAYRADLFKGSYSIGNVSVRIDNTQKDDAAGSNTRFTDNFSSNEFETEICTIYLGYEGISSVNDLFPYYKGKMSSFEYGILSLSFDVVDSRLFDLPDIPQNKITRGAAYNAVNEDLIDKPIPLVYGTWESITLYKHKDKSFIPAYIVDYDPDSATPDMTLEIADHQIDSIEGGFPNAGSDDKLIIWDDKREMPGYIQDTIAEDLTNARMTVSFNTENSDAFMTVFYFLYPRPRSGNNEPTDDTLFNSFDIDTEGGTYIVSFPNISAFSTDEMISRHSDSGGRLSQELEAYIEFAGYLDATTWAANDEIILALNTQQSGNYITMDNSEVNGLGVVKRTTTSDFNWETSDAGNIALVLTYPKHFDGSADHAFAIQEAGGSINITPNEGYYYTMQILARECERQCQQLTDAATLTNDYHVTYLKTQNKFRIEAVNTSVTAFKVNTSGTRAADVGFTGATASNTSAKESDDFTFLDVPDGDFSNLKLKLTVQDLVGGSVASAFHLQALRIKIIRKILSYNVKQTHTETTTSFIPIPYGSQPIGFTPGVTIRETIVNERILQDQRQSDSVTNFVEGSTFFVCAQGREYGSWITGRGGPSSGDVIDHSPYIIESLLRDEAGLVDADINEGSFDTAYDQIKDSVAVGKRLHHVLYLDKVSKMESVLFDLARFGRSFLFLGQDGKYKMAPVLNSYASSDQTIFLRDIKAPWNQNFKIMRSQVGNTAQDLDFHFQPDNIRRKYHGFLNQSNDNTLNIVKREMFCNYVNIQDSDDSKDYASNEIDYFCGDGSTIGQFGEPKTVIEFVTLTPEYHFLEIGDTVQFDTEFDSHIDAFGGTLSSIYFMVTGKQYSRKEIEFQLLEVG